MHNPANDVIDNAVIAETAVAALVRDHPQTRHHVALHEPVGGPRRVTQQPAELGAKGWTSQP